MQFVALWLEGFNMYEGGKFQFKKGFMYISLINNVSTWVSRVHLSDFSSREPKLF